MVVFAIPVFSEVMVLVVTLNSAKLLIAVLLMDVKLPPIYYLLPLTANAFTVLLALGSIASKPLVEIR